MGPKWWISVVAIDNIQAFWKVDPDAAAVTGWFASFGRQVATKTLKI